MNRIGKRPRSRALTAVVTGLLISAVAGCSSSATPSPATPSPATATASATAAAATAAATATATAATATASATAAASMPALPTTQMTGTVAFMVPDSTDSHWLSQDAVSFQTWMKQLAPNVKVLVLNATGDPTNQLNQAQAALTQGATVLAVAAVDGAQAGKIALAAQAAKANVIAYTRDITGGPVTYMVGADPHAIGVSLANYMVSNTKAGDTIAIIAGDPADSFAIAEHSGYMSVLQPLFDSGARIMVGNVWTPGWDTTKAHAEMDAILTSSHNNVQGALTSNDSTAQGAIGALQTVGLAGKIPVTGVDASLISDQLILKGLQSMSSWRSFDTQAQYTAELSVYLLTGQTPPTVLFNGATYNDGTADVPTMAVPSISITVSNMQQLIDNGTYTKADMCQGIPAGTGPC